jgi:hypothetical protein
VHGFELRVGDEPIERLAERFAAIAITSTSVHALVDAHARTHRVIGHPEGREQLRRLIRRFADALYDGLDAPASDRLVFRECMGFLLETETFWHWPIRHMARRLARSAPVDRSFAIELAGTSLCYGLLWNRNELWPLTAAAELARAGRTAFLYVRGDPARALDRIEIAPSRDIARPARQVRDVVATVLTAFSPNHHVVCPQTIRNARAVVAGLGHPLRLRLGMDRRRPWRRLDVTPLRDEIGAETLALEPADAPETGIAAYRGVWPPGGLARRIAARLDRVIATAYRKAERSAKWRRVARFDTADHLSLEAGAYGVAVSRNGGVVRLWPHASSPIALEYRAPTFAAVVAPTTLAAQSWRERFPSAEVTVSPRTVFPPFTLDAPRDASGIVTLVMFNIRGALGAMPRFDGAAHEASLRDLVERIRNSTGIRLLYKSKLADDIAWFRGEIDPHGVAEFTDASHAELDQPNMVFTSPTVASTALLEGICRGAPAVLLRDTPAWDHVPIDPRFVPVEGARELIATLARLRDPKCYAELAIAQEKWLRTLLPEGARAT